MWLTRRLLRGEGAGLLIKDSGGNIVPWQGRSFSATRICHPDGQLYKLMNHAGPGPRPRPDARPKEKGRDDR